MGVAAAQRTGPAGDGCRGVGEGGGGMGLERARGGGAWRGLVGWIGGVARKGRSVVVGFIIFRGILQGLR